MATLTTPLKPKAETSTPTAPEERRTTAAQRPPDSPAAPAVDEAKLQSLMEQVVRDAGAAYTAPLILIGDRLGLYKAMANGAPLSPRELAERTGTEERYIREWLNNQAASGYVEYFPETGLYRLPPEQAMAFADEDSPVFIAGIFEGVESVFHDKPKLLEAFETGRGIGWHERHHCLFRGTERLFRTGYRANLVTSWLPALEGVEEKLRAGALVADVGCGHGASTLIMAEAFPRSTFVGFDYHIESVETARQRARDAGLEGRVTFEAYSAKDFPGRDYDLVTIFDALHDMGDPTGAARHIRDALRPDGTLMVVEPFAGDRLEENLNPIGRLFYAASTAVCTPASRAQEVGLALGAQAGEARLRDVVLQGGFTRFRRAAETPFNLIFEARP